MGTYLHSALLKVSVNAGGDYVDLSKRPWHILNTGDDPKLFVLFFPRKNVLNEVAPRHLLDDRFQFVKQYCQKAPPKAALASGFAAVRGKPAAAARRFPQPPCFLLLSSASVSEFSFDVCLQMPHGTQCMLMLCRSWVLHK